MLKESKALLCNIPRPLVFFLSQISLLKTDKNIIEYWEGISDYK